MLQSLWSRVEEDPAAVEVTEVGVERSKSGVKGPSETASAASSTGWIEIVRLWKNGAMQLVALEGLEKATLQQELLLSATVALGAKGAKVVLRKETRILKLEEAQEEAWVATGGVVDVCVVESGGMPGGTGTQEVFATSGSQELVSGLPEPVHAVEEFGDGWMQALFRQLTCDVSAIEAAVQRLDHARSGSDEQHPLLSEQNAQAASSLVNFKVKVLNLPRWLCKMCT